MNSGKVALPDGLRGDFLTPLRFLQRSVQVYGHKVAVKYQDTQYTYQQFYDRVMQLASGLLKLGVTEGDRVAILCQNIPPMLEAHFAVPWIGAVLVPVNCRITSPEIEYIVKFSAPKVFLVDVEFHGLVTGIHKSLSEVVQYFVTINDILYLRGLHKTDQPPTLRIEGGMTYDEILASGSTASIPDKVKDEWQMISINFTSGTTGNPKGVMVHHRGAFLNSLDEIMNVQFISTSVYLWVLPMFHANGWNFTFGVVAAGGTHVCLRKISDEAIFRLIDSENVTHFCAAPVICASMAKYSQDHHITQVKRPITILTAAAPPSLQTFEAMEKLGIKLIHVYGLTEVHGPNTICSWQEEWANLSVTERNKQMTRQGVPYICPQQMDVVDPTTMTPVARDGNTVGEIVMKGNVMLGYYNDPEGTAKCFEHGWFHTGDLAVMHPNNYVEVMDRSKDIIISGGENISSLQVERVLCQYEKVRSCVVIAVPDEKWGEVPKAFVVLKDAVDGGSHQAVISDLLRYCRTQLPGFKVPKHVEIVDAIPINSTGKPNKQLLRSQEWKGQGKMVH